MNCLALLRALEANSRLSTHQLRSSQLFSRCSDQATFLLHANVQTPFLQLQQLHTSTAAAIAAAAAAVPQQQAGSQAAAAAAKNLPESNASSDTSSSNTGRSNATLLQQVDTGAGSGMLSSVLTSLGSKQMDGQHIGLYYDFNTALVPEAFQPFHQAFYSPRPARQQRKGGCRGLQAELSLTHSSGIKWRRATQELQGAISSGAVPHIHIRGSAGAGKSIAVVQMVEWARSNGWIALYVPSASALTRGGFFYRRQDSDTYDTLISAQQILKSMGDSHATELTQLQLQLPASRELLQLPEAASGAEDSSNTTSSRAASGAVEGGLEETAAAAAAAAAAGGGSKSQRKGKKGAAAAAADVEGSLMQLVVAGLSTDDDGRLAVEACLCLIKELVAVSDRQPVLLAVDDYNALYWHTEYGRTLFVSPPNGPDYQYRKEVPVEQLNLARNLRLLERTDLGKCRVVVADSASNRVAPSAAVPSGDAGVYHMPRFSEVETAHALYYYHERGLTAQTPSQQQVSAMRALTNGSGADLRKWCLKITQTDMGLL